MPIAAGFSLLKSQIEMGLGKDGASAAKASAQIVSGLSSVIPMGIFIGTPPVTFPLPPAGVALAQNMIMQAFTLKQGSSPEVFAQLFASGISLACPLVPPTGLAVLQNAISSAMKIKQGSSPSLVATLIANGIVTYYMSSGVVV